MIGLLKPAEMKMNQAGTVYYTDKEDSILAKACRQCGAIKTLEGFNVNKTTLGGRQSKCRECTRRKDRRHLEVNREEINKRKRERYVNNAGDNQRYYRNNKERIDERNRRWRKKNPEYHKRHYRENPEYYREYRKENSEAIYLNNERRRARKHSLPYTLTLEQKASIKEHFSNSCALTGDTDNIHFDHVIPISVGHGGTTLENMMPLRGDLNNSKYTRNIFEWFESEKEYYGLSQERFDKAIAYLAEVNDMAVSEYREYVYACHDSPAY